MAASERDSGRAEAMPRGRDGWRAEVMTSGREGGRAERAVPRRGTIMVSPTQLVPEVLAVWGSD